MFGFEHFQAAFLSSRSQSCLSQGKMPGGGIPYESDGDARRKIRIKPLKETHLGVVQALFDP